MRLISNAEAALPIGAKANGVLPSAEDALLAGVISGLLPKIEESLNVKSLVRTSWEDSFRLPLFCRRTGKFLRLRLSNGFLDPDTPVILTDPDGAETTIDADHRFDEYGYVDIESSVAGLHRVYYDAGFAPTPYEAPDPLPDGYVVPLEATDPLLTGVPEWIKAMVKAYLIKWYRIEVLAPKLPGKGEGRTAQMLADAIRQEIQARCYSRYMRQRDACQWAIRSIVVPPSVG
jgi:hypothetical protein